MARKEIKGEFLTFYQQLAVNNPCYKKGEKRTKTTHLILHSTGCDNANLRRYVIPDDGALGNNPNANGWNSPNSGTFVHGVIGKNAAGNVECYQIAPWDLRVWGVGSGKNGNGNDFTIQIEMAEDRTLGATYAKQCYDVAVKMYAHLCKAFGIDPNNIWSHTECCKVGYGSNHGDPEMWWSAVRSGLTMDGFRRDVSKMIATQTQPDTPHEETVMYRVQVGAFAKKENAQAMLAKLQNAGFEGFIASTTNTK